MAWMNNDGLYVKYGTEEAFSTHPAGAFGGTLMGEHVMEVSLRLNQLTQTETILNDVVWLPNNCQIMWVESVTLVAAATGTAIDVGLIDQDRTTEIDYDGLLAAFPTAEMAQVGETRRFYETHTVPATMTGTGALVGQELTNTGYISASMTDATAFTAGVIRLRVGYFMSGIDEYGV